MGWLIDCKRSRSLLQSKTAAAAPRGHGDGTGRLGRFWPVLFEEGWEGAGGGCVPPPLHPSPFVAAGSKPLLGSLSRSGCVPLAGMHPRSRTAQPLRTGGLGSPVSERLGRVGWGPPWASGWAGWAGVPRERAAGPGGLGSPVSERLGRAGWGPPQAGGLRGPGSTVSSLAGWAGVPYEWLGRVGWGPLRAAGLGGLGSPGSGWAAWAGVHHEQLSRAGRGPPRTAWLGVLGSPASSWAGWVGLLCERVGWGPRFAPCVFVLVPGVAESRRARAAPRSTGVGRLWGCPWARGAQC